MRLKKSLLKHIPQSRIITSQFERTVIGSDASFYRLVPGIIIRAANEEEIKLILKACVSLNLPVTFRAAGTSLSGQAQTDSVLVITGTDWNKFSISNNADSVTVQPGLTGGKLNQLLLPFGRKIGPDPASINAAMIGGIAANNASGMCCGISKNSYKTLRSMKIIFYDGTTLDTGDEDSIRKFRRSHDHVIDAINNLSTRVKSKPDLSGLIRKKFSIKNTTGYSLNALIDFEDPIEIIQHLMIGSEGTLGFISEITLDTVPEYSHKATSLLFFSDILSACKTIKTLKELPVNAAEIMDRASLSTVQGKPGAPQVIEQLDKKSAALLIETSAENPESLDKNVFEITNALKAHNTLFPVEFTSEPLYSAMLWNIRKGLFPSVGAIRRTGTSVIIEDVAVAIDHLPSLMEDLQNLFKRCAYNNAIIFGHALDGNLHFVFSPDFNKQDEITKYKSFMDELARLITDKYEGSFKAEHGTGRNAAPFVEQEWGKDAYSLMKQIKRIFDPLNILNPGVLINNDPDIHVKNLKPMPAANPLIDKCTECGFCESICVSNEFTFSPRQRITAYREIIRQSSKNHLKSNIKKIFKYQADESCAADGLCELKCPVGINTGAFVKELRAVESSSLKNIVADIASNNFNYIFHSLRTGLVILALLKKIPGLSLLIKKNFVLNLLPGAAPKIKTGTNSVAGIKKAVYFPACITRSFGYADGSSVPRHFNSLLNKAGYQVIYPDGIASLCCGLAFTNWGYPKAGNKKLNQLIETLHSISDGWKLPVIVDNSPCLHHITESAGVKNNILSISQFTNKYLIDELHFSKRKEAVKIYHTCSTQRMWLQTEDESAALLCAENVDVIQSHCCGFAGYKGFLLPGLNQFAIKNLQEDLCKSTAPGYSNSRTCEIGLDYHTGIRFGSIAQLINESTTAKVKQQKAN